ncbi:MAG TPA: hypothetical protein VIJ75_20935 [Hanamia sp.]
MKKKINFCLLLLTLFTIDSFAQNASLQLSKEQTVKDSIEFAKFKENYPENFLNKRLPIKLIEDGYVINGFSTSIQITDGIVMDSVYHNFHPGMPDTSTVIPFNDIKIAGSNLNINLFSHLVIMGGNHRDSSIIIPVDPNKIGILTIGDFDANATSIKISINGKIMSDWTLLKNYTKQSYEVSKKYLDFGGVKMSGYSYGYNICNLKLQLNDQVLIEIKNDKNNWMLDRYNITRVPAVPNLSSSIFSNSNKNFVVAVDKSSPEKKNSFLTQPIKL